MADQQVIIIGAGPGGLAAAMLLAGAGVSVRVLERQRHVGGRTSAIEGEGFRFDLGPTFFLYGQVLESIFQQVGRNLHDYLRLVKLDPQYRLVFGSGGEIVATPRLEQLKAAVARICPADAANLDGFMADNRKKLQLFKPCLENPFLGLGDVLSMHMLRLLPSLRPWNSLDRELGRYFSDPRVRLAFSFQAKYLGMSPFRCPSLFSILSFLEYEYGVWHPIGGCSAVTAAMAKAAQELGVQLHLDEPVEELLFEGRRAVGVRTNRASYRGLSVVINADFAHAMTHLVPDHLRRRWTDRKIARKKFSCSTFMLYLGMKGTYDDQPHHNIYLSHDYKQNLADIEDLHRLSEDPSIYVQNACVTDPSLAPAGMSTLYVLAPVTHQHANVHWDAEKAQFRRRVLGQLPHLGFKDVEERMVFERVITPDDWNRSASLHLGATFSLAHNFGQMLHLRPRNRFEDLDGVYLVGGGTHPGSGLPVIFESARITTRLMLKDMGISSGRPAPQGAELAESGSR